MHPIHDCLDFNLRSREGSDSEQYGMPERLEIPIHAPVKGATDLVTRLLACLEISIHAPVKGATTVSAKIFHPTHDFNPRSREGSDLRGVRTGYL